MRNKQFKQERTEKRGERSEGIKAYFVRVLGKYDFRNEAHFLHVGKWLIFILVLLMECLLLLQQVGAFIMQGGGVKLVWVLVVVGVLSISVALQFFVVKGWGKKVCYVVDVIAACAVPIFAGGVYSVALYMLVLTQFYFEAKKAKQSVIILIVSILLYTFAYGLRSSILYGAEAWNLWRLLNSTFGFIVGIITHFLAVHIALAFYRQYLKLSSAMQELEESKKELERAYAVVAEVSALEERQRIAKDIHDTAGHSLTTVIMQTESAKRILDSNPEEAKGKIIAANLQAKHALEELRDSVHLLSGGGEKITLADALLSIIHDSTDGTGIAIRSEIAELKVSPAKHRFLCNSLKEGISNGLRHGGATAFWVELKEEEGKIDFLLSDNGKGADEGLVRGFGLTTMQERAKALGGEVSFLSDPEEGFELRIVLPIDKEAV